MQRSKNCVTDIAKIRWFTLGVTDLLPDFRQPYQEAERIGKAHPATFDTLDFDVYTNQKWDRLQESHAQDIVVHYPDGHQSKGLAAHIEELKPMFVFAPDTRIQVHPVKIASGEWTSVIGVIED